MQSDSVNPSPTPRDETEAVRTKVRTLCAYRDMTPTELGSRLGLSRASMSKRMIAASFTLPELLAISALLDVEPTVWLDAPANTLRHVRDAAATA